MKTILIAALAVAMHITAAQNIRGGFGHAYFGPGYNISTQIQRDLQAQALLGNDLRLNKPAMVGGGGGYGVFKKILIGGSGLGYKVADATSRGQATVSWGGGFVNVGYLVVSKESMLAFPYVGIGGNSLNLRVKNGSTNESFTIGNKVIGPGQYLDLHAEGMSFEAGYAFKFLAFSIDGNTRDGGLMVGVQLGAYAFAGLEDWHDDATDDMVIDFSNAWSFSPYLRITIGGGGFRIVPDK